MSKKTLRVEFSAAIHDRGELLPVATSILLVSAGGDEVDLILRSCSETPKGQIDTSAPEILRTVLASALTKAAKEVFARRLELGAKIVGEQATEVAERWRRDEG